MANVTNLSKAEYLKRYISGDTTNKKKKKKKKVPVVAPRSRIVDDDVDFKSLLPSNLENTLDEDVGDNEPTIAGYVDERPEEVQLLERYRSGEGWKGIGSSTDPSSTKRTRHDSDSDQSMPRRGRHDSDSDQSLPRRGRHDSDSDQSLPRRGRHDSDSDQSLPRRGRHDSDSDQSPKRLSRQDSDSDQSPPRMKNRKSKSDLSIQTKRDVSKNNKKSNSDCSPMIKGTKVKTKSSQSPARRQKDSSDSDQSPVRRQRHNSDSDQSPVRRRRHNSDSDHSSSRKHSESSPAKKRLKTKDGRKSRFDSDNSASNSQTISDKMTKTLSGKKAGLSSAMDMRMEAEIIKRKEDEAFRKIDKDKLGKEAATVYRDKSGRRRNMAEEEKEKQEKDAKLAVQDAKYEAWGQGLKQKADQEARLSDHLHEMSKPLARYRDDSDLDSMMRDQEREGDPMLAFLSKKKKKQDGTKKKELPAYKGPAGPPNRFGIKPGYRWDGVNRSNGFENQLFSKMSSRKATADDAYKWSTEDM